MLYSVIHPFRNLLLLSVSERQAEQRIRQSKTNVMKQLLIFLLIAGHIIVNGVAAAVHMTEDYEHGHDVPHQHFLTGDKVVIQDIGHHDHDEGAHMHLEFQLSDATLYQFKHVQIGRYYELKRLFSSTDYSPPVPPPTQ